MAYKITDKCKGCEDCVKVCTRKAISGEMKKQHTIDPALCDDCGECNGICEYESILDNRGKRCKYIPPEKRGKDGKKSLIGSLFGQKK